MVGHGEGGGAGGRDSYRMEKKEMRRQRETHRDIEWGVGRLQGERTETERRNKHIPTQKEKNRPSVVIL